AADHGVLPVQLAWEQGHALVLGGRSPQRRQSEREEILRLDQLRTNGLAAVRGIRAVVGALRTREFHQSRVFDPVRLRRGHGEDDALADVLFGVECEIDYFSADD